MLIFHLPEPDTEARPGRWWCLSMEGHTRPGAVDEIATLCTLAQLLCAARLYVTACIDSPPRPKLAHCATQNEWITASIRAVQDTSKKAFCGLYGAA